MSLQHDKTDPSFPLHSAAFGFSPSQVWTPCHLPRALLRSQELTSLFDDFMLRNSSLFSTVHQMRPSVHCLLSPLPFPTDLKCSVHCPESERSSSICLPHTHSASVAPGSGSAQTPACMELTKKVRVRGSLASPHLLDAVLSGKGLRLCPSEPTQIQQDLNKCHHVPVHLKLFLR